MKRGRWRDWLKLGLAATVEGSGLGVACRTVRTLAAGPRIHVLGYHRVVDAIDFGGAVNPSLCITSGAFRQQMEQLRERFLVLPLSYVVRAVAGEIHLPSDAVAVTFDDGYRDVLLRADPILRELAIPATVFVPTGFADAHGRARLLPHDRLYAAAWAAQQAGQRLARLGDSETALLLARADRVLAQSGPAGVVEDLIDAAPAATLARIIDALEAAAGAPALDDGAEVVSPAEVRTLARHGWEIGAHTVGHVGLDARAAAEQRRQLVSVQRRARVVERPALPLLRLLQRLPLARPRRRAAPRRLRRRRHHLRSPQRAKPAAAIPSASRARSCGKRTRAAPSGAFSPSLSAAHLHDTFGALGLTHPIDGEVPSPTPPSPPNEEIIDSQPTEVELAY